MSYPNRVRAYHGSKLEHKNRAAMQRRNEVYARLAELNVNPVRVQRLSTTDMEYVANTIQKNRNFGLALKELFKKMWG